MFNNSATKKTAIFIHSVKRDDFCHLYKKYWKELYLIAYKFTCRSDDSKDIVQEVFISLLENFKDREIENIHPYLIQALRYKCINWLRKNKIAEKHLKVINSLKPANTTEDSINFSLTKQAVQNAVMELPEKCQQVFRLSRFEHMTHEQIALRLEISPKTVENYITRALKKMRLSLQKEEIIISITLFITCFS